MPVIPSPNLAGKSVFGLEAKAKATAAPKFHYLEGDSPLVFVIEGSRLFSVEPQFFAALRAGDGGAENDLIEMLPQLNKPRNDFGELAEPTAISLNVAQSCNLSCAYCYADEGRYGSGKTNLMDSETAFAAIDRLFDGVRADGRKATIGFIGGEPFVNRKVLHESVAYARRRVNGQNNKVGFSVTTNATLLQESDISLLRENSFAVTVSLDGGETVNNRMRRTANGASSSYARAVENIKPLLRNPGRAKVFARATVTRADMNVSKHIEALAVAGFAEIGVSPLRHSPDPSLALAENDWKEFLKEMIRAGEGEIERLRRGEKLRFSNFGEALRQIHRGASRNLPCGSVVNYVSVSAEGNYYTCHRTVNNQQLELGNLTDGLSQAARKRFLEARVVDAQGEPCASCWARYLCGGGCHAEVLAVGRAGCDYIRGWLEFCLRAYDRLWSENLLPFDFEGNL